MLVAVALFFTIIGKVSQVAAVTCYQCESHRGEYGCSDPFVYSSIEQINCDTAHFVRERKPVFCEKKTDIVDGYYVTTRGCSSEFRWEDIQQYADHRGGHIPCIRQGTKETCLCTGDRCNSATRFVNNVQNVPLLISAILFYVNLYY